MINNKLKFDYSDIVMTLVNIIDCLKRPPILFKQM